MAEQHLTREKLDLAFQIYCTFLYLHSSNYWCRTATDQTTLHPSVLSSQRSWRRRIQPHHDGIIQRMVVRLRRRHKTNDVPAFSKSQHWIQVLTATWTISYDTRIRLPIMTTIGGAKAYTISNLDCPTLSKNQRLLLKWHHHSSHLNFGSIQDLARQGHLEKALTACEPPLCKSCQCGKAHHCPVASKEKANLLTQTTPNLVMRGGWSTCIVWNWLCGCLQRQANDC